MWIHSSYEFMSSCEFIYQINSLIMWIHTSDEFMILCEFIQSDELTHYVNSYNQMNSQYFLNSYIRWIYMFADEFTCMNSCSFINLSGMGLAPREVLYSQDWELLLDLTLSKSKLNITCAYLYTQSSVSQKIVLQLPWSTNVQSEG